MDKFLECLSVALDLVNEDSLNRYHTGSMHMSSLIHYPAVSTQRLRFGEVIRNSAHSDSGTLTLLLQHDVGGPKIADMSSTDTITTTAVEKDANFIAIDPKPGTIVVIVGYLLMRWTNGRWENVVHRMVDPANFTSNGALKRVLTMTKRPLRDTVSPFSAVRMRLQLLSLFYLAAVSRCRSDGVR